MISSTTLIAGMNTTARVDKPPIPPDSGWGTRRRYWVERSRSGGAGEFRRLQAGMPLKHPPPCGGVLLAAHRRKALLQRGLGNVYRFTSDYHLRVPTNGMGKNWQIPGIICQEAALGGP